MSPSSNRLIRIFAVEPFHSPFSSSNGRHTRQVLQNIRFIITRKLEHFIVGTIFYSLAIQISNIREVILEYASKLVNNK